MCMQECEFGYLQDKFGCDNCKCKPDPCKVTRNVSLNIFISEKLIILKLYLFILILYYNNYFIFQRNSFKYIDEYINILNNIK